MIDILIVEDNNGKLAKIKKLITDDLMLAESVIHSATDIKSAKRLMINTAYDLLILDLVLPLEAGEDPAPENGIRFLNDINANPRLIPPVHIVGVTEFDEFEAEFAAKFTDKLWHLINYKASEVNWQDKLKVLINHLVTTKLRFYEKSISSMSKISDANDVIGNPDKSGLIKPSHINSIFISHASADKRIVNEFVELLEVAGIEHSSIFYSSLPEYGITPGANFLDFIKDKISDNVLVVFMLSANFYSSSVCLCEMGAAWVMSKEHIPIVIPPFGFSDVKGVLPVTQGVVINEKLSLNTLMNQVCLLFNLPAATGNITWERKRDKILERINAEIEVQ